MSEKLEHPYSQEIRARILKALSNNQILHITEIAKRGNTTRITARKHLERLKREGVVDEIRRGSLRLFVLKDTGNRGSLQ